MKFRPQRRICDFPLTVRIGPKRHKVMIRDVTPHGVRVKGLAGVAVGTMVALDLTSPPLKAQVRWVGGGMAGLFFTRSIGKTLEEKIRRSTAGAGQGRQRVGQF